MIVDVSVQYDGGLLPDTIESFCSYSQCSHLNLLTCSEGLDAFRFFLKDDICKPKKCPEDISSRHLWLISNGERTSTSTLALSYLLLGPVCKTLTL